MNSLPSTQETVSIVLASAKDAVVNTIDKARDTIYPPAEPMNSTPEPPRGIPPSEDCHKGKVAYEDKSITGKLSENIETLQSNFSSLRRPSLEALINLQTEGIPQPPHGQPPSDTNHKGVVADQDKSYYTRVSENIPSISDYTPSLPSLPLPSWSEYKQEIYAFYESFPQNFTDTVNQAKATIGLAPSPAPGVAPAPPRGIPPSDDSRGRVSNADKSIQLQLEENWEMLNSEFLKLWTQSKRKLGWNWIKPGTVPEPPRGIPPSNASSSGVVDDRDKTITTNIDEAVSQFRDVTQKKIDDALKSIQETTNSAVAAAGDAFNQSSRLVSGLSNRSSEGAVPEPPHGIPPSQGISTGIVAEEDKTLQQKAGDAWEQVKEVAKERIADTKRGLDNFANETSSTLTGGDL